MKKRLKAWLPTPQSIKDNRWLRWMGPALHHPRLWHFSRKGIAMGLALGIWCQWRKCLWPQAPPSC